jgi:uncharacterized protein
MKPSEYQLLWTQQIQDLSQDEWDAMAKPLKTPFFEWDWLNTMSTSQSTTAKSGWLPNHLTLWRSGRLVAAAPLYVKGHSYGEFVFDQQWAELADRMGINYYLHPRRGLPIPDRPRGRSRHRHPDSGGSDRPVLPQKPHLRL